MLTLCAPVFPRQRRSHADDDGFGMLALCLRPCGHKEDLESEVKILRALFETPPQRPDQSDTWKGRRNRCREARGVSRNGSADVVDASLAAPCGDGAWRCRGMAVPTGNTATTCGRYGCASRGACRPRDCWNKAGRRNRFAPPPSPLGALRSMILTIECLDQAGRMGPECACGYRAETRLSR
jgi:hypothetical protein